MAIKARGEFIDVNDQVNLVVQFKDISGNPLDVDSYPKISIIQPSGGVLLTPTSAGVSRVDVGKYSYIFTVPYNGPYGVFNDVWSGYVSGFRMETTFQFVVAPSQMTMGPNSDGYVSLGDDPGFHYSQAAIKNINKLIKGVKARLNSSGKAKAKDGYGNTIYVDCDIFSIDMLTTFLATSLTEFNQTPYFTFFQFDDDNFVEQFFAILVQGAVVYALGSHALIEAGRNYQIQDSGISLNMPTVSELLNSQYGSLLTNHYEALKYIKNSLRPAPIGLGVYSMNSGINPAFARLRHLKARRIY